MRPPSFGVLVRRYRRNAGWTQQELAERARVGTRTINEIERSTGVRPQRETVRLLADTFGLDGDERAAFEHAARYEEPTTPTLVGPLRPNLPAPVTQIG